MKSDPDPAKLCESGRIRVRNVAYETLFYELQSFLIFCSTLAYSYLIVRSPDTYSLIKQQFNTVSLCKIGT